MSRVAVIIPVLNVADTIGRVLEALTNQTYPGIDLDIIVVDNGSEDHTRDIVKSYDVTLLEERSVRSPYAARNRGMQAVGEKVDIIALTDGNKVPEPDWIEEGVNAMNNGDADLVAGQVDFYYSDPPRLAEQLDSLLFIDNEQFVHEQKAGAGGNLFFRKQVWDTIGPFPDRFRSGMDIWWSQEASSQGFTIVYAPLAVVKCQARGLNGILKKSYRVGKVHPHIMVASGRSLTHVFMEIIRTFLPPRPAALKERIERKGKPSLMSYLVRLWLMQYATKIAMAMGRSRGLLTLLTDREHKNQ